MNIKRSQLVTKGYLPKLNIKSDRDIMGVITGD